MDGLNVDGGDVDFVKFALAGKRERRAARLRPRKE